MESGAGEGHRGGGMIRLELCPIADTAAQIATESVDAPTAASDTWNTPAQILALARRVMGGIDTDPASNEAAQAVVRATTFYTADSNGLAHEWTGRVWLNPPYSNVTPFVTKLLGEYDAGRTTAAIVLVNARTGAFWFQELARRAHRCEIRKRVRFWRSDRPAGSTGRQDSVAFYLGPSPRRFILAFRFLGTVTAPASVSVTRACASCAGPVLGRADALFCCGACRMRAYRRRAQQCSATS